MTPRTSPAASGRTQTPYKRRENTLVPIGGGMSEPEDLKPPGQEAISLYKTLVDTRNFEINLFWQRSNYFLVLNTGIAFGFFQQSRLVYAWIFALMGLLASCLWFCVCLGSKFWQTRWEQRLHDFEEGNFADLNFFSADWKRVHSDVSTGLGLQRLGVIQKSIYALVPSKPSVSFAMIALSILFVFGWIATIVAFGLGVRFQ